MKKAIKKGLILINGTTAKTATWIYQNQVIELIENPSKKPKVYKFNLDVVFEDDFMAVIIKPAGITVSGNTFKTVANALAFNLNKSSQQDALEIPTPIHRLDNQTSGILLIAKTKTAQVELGKQFANQTIQKIYCAITIGKIIENQHITLNIDEKLAETSFEIVKVVKSLKFNELTCLKVSPKTGRTHQIRIHLASIGHPILGDKLYGDKKNLYKGKGLFLCASEISFSHPKTLKTIHLKIEIPHKFKSVLIRERRRWKTYNN